MPRKNIQGRNRIPLSDMVFAVVFKTYAGVSGRRFSSDLMEAKRRGFITQAPHFNSLFNYLEMEDMSYILKGLIRESASPMKTVEMDFAVDSSGFAKGTTVKWLHEKYSNPHESRIGTATISGLLLNPSSASAGLKHFTKVDFFILRLLFY